MPEFYLEGVLRKKWDDVARIYSEYDEAGALASERAYNTEENARADAEMRIEEAAAKAVTAKQEIRAKIQELRASIGDGDSPGGTDTLNAIINTTNPILNASPAMYIKALARVVRSQVRATIQTAQIISNEFEGTTP